MSPIRLAIVRVILASPLLCLGCTSMLGVQDLPSNTCSTATVTGECGVCSAASCCDEFEQCWSDPICNGLLSCADTCGGDSSCVSACGTAYSSGIPEYNAIVTCREANCPSSCSGGS